MDPRQHPLRATAAVIGSLQAERRAPRMMHMQSANEGPVDIIAKVSGVVKGDKREDDGPYFTNNEGIPLPDASHSKTFGGIPVASDVHLFQKQQHFNRPKPLERMLHPCGSGAIGFFECTKDVTSLTKANFLSSVGEKTPIFIRFSTHRSYDIVGLNFPVFFCRDPIQGPDVIRSQYRNPVTGLLDFNSLFDLLAHTPEGNHAGLMFFSDHGTPQGWRHNHGYGCHTFKWVNASGIMQPKQADPDVLRFDPFDVTKVWPREQFPLWEFGRLKLNKNPENFLRDVKQAAFSPESMVPGVEDSPDPLLQFRTFFYRDAPVSPDWGKSASDSGELSIYGEIVCEFEFRPMRTDANHAGNPQYAPNSFKDKFRPDVAEAPFAVSDNVVSRKSHCWHEGKMNDYAQATALMNTFHNTAKYVGYVEYPEIQLPQQKKYLAQLHNISPDYAEGVYRRLKEPKFSLDKVQSMSKDALLWGHNKKFMPSMNKRLAGFGLSAPIYNTGF
ncbi:catalase-like domain-containing protein [Schizothecium vesticola]|uniref:Catalase-like domain-containing protein n=1 Tax=Schizothecium vesticola TaxID=314040 RepID=A0AA40F7X5_9PEZI|nr:catalase-like domain-containing protein [Schizothecium vesticola]